MDSNVPPPRAFRTPSVPSAARPGAQPTARTGSVVASLDNGADVTIDDSSCTGGNGLYGRPALGVPDSIVRELQRRLGVMYTERLEAVQAAKLHRSAIRQRHAIMDENPGSVGERSVAVLQRLRDGVSCDLSFQTLRLKRLGPVPPSTGADDVACPYERERSRLLSAREGGGPRTLDSQGRGTEGQPDSGAPRVFAQDEGSRHRLASLPRESPALLDTAHSSQPAEAPSLDTSASAEAGRTTNPPIFHAH